MKNKLLKISLVVIVAFIFIGGRIFVNAQMNNVYSNMNGSSNFYAGNELNHSIFSYILPGYAGGLGVLGTVAILFGIALIAFWIWMLVHAIKHDIDYKPVWILVLWFMNIFGAIVYYFAVKRQCPCCQSYENVCLCNGDGECTCGAIKTEKVEEVKEKLKEELES